MSDFEQSIDWPTSAFALRDRLGPDAIEPRVADWLESHEGDSILVACSGGSDSIFALCLLWAWSKELNIRIVVGHYNHRWRAEASNLDAEFVGKVAGGLDCPFELEVRSENEAAFTETAARELRLDFLRRAAKKYQCSAIALGHQRDDILETQLIRLSRGVGSEGLSAPRPVNTFPGHPDHIRPILHYRAGDISMALNVCGILWREDSSNEDTTILRNSLRHEVIPNLMGSLDRDVQAGAARSRELLEEDAAALKAIAEARFPEAFRSETPLDRVLLRAEPRAITRRVLTAWLSVHKLTGSLSGRGHEALLDAVYDSKQAHRMSLGVGFVRLTRSSVEIERETDAAIELSCEVTLLGVGETVLLPTGGQVSLERVEMDSKLYGEIVGGEIDSQGEAFFKPEMDGPFEVRAWRSGDRFSPIGAPGTKKLKDWFIDRHIPLAERKRLPVVSTPSGEIIWVSGFAPADSMKISLETDQALRLTYQIRKTL